MNLFDWSYPEINLVDYSDMSCWLLLLLLLLLLLTSES